MTESRAIAPVSVVIPCFRCKDTIVRAVSSVAQQTCLPRELILVDDASKDGTLALLNELARAYPEGWLRIVVLEKNLGAGEARNAGWQVATQEFVAFLDSDDSWCEEKIEVQWSFMRTNPALALTGYTNREPRAGGGSSLALLPVRSCDVLLRNPFWTSSVMLRRAVAPRFRRGQRYAEDYLLWQEIICSGAQAARLPVNMGVSYKPAFGASGLSSHLWRMERCELGNYVILRRSGHIGWGAQLIFQLISLVKFSRRFAVTALRKRSVAA